MELLRAEEVDTVVRWIERGANVEIVGPRLSGRTSLLVLARRALNAAGWTTVRLAGVPALRDQPLEALRLARLIEARKPGTTAADAVDQLRQQWEGKRVVVFIDDVDSLDRISFGVVDALSQVISFGLVSAGPLRSANASQHSVNRLRQPCVEHVMRPWAYAATSELLTQRDGQFVDPWLAARIYQMAGGIPGLAIALLDAANAGSFSDMTRAIWRSPESILWDPGLARMIEDYIGPLSPEERDGLETLTARAPVVFDEAVEAVGTMTLRSLEDQALISTTCANGLVHVVVSPPIVAEYLHWHQGEVHRLIRSSESNEVGRLRGTRAPFGREEHSALRQLLTAHREVEEARLAQRWRAEPTVTNALPYVALLTASPRNGDDIDEVLDFTRWETGTDRDRALTITDIVRWKAAVTSAEAARAMLETRRASFGRLEPMANCLEFQLQIAAREIPEYDEALMPVEPDMPGPLRTFVLATRTLFALVTGHFAEAEAGSEEMGLPVGRPRTVLLRAVALTMRGRLPEAIDVAMAGLTAAKNAFDSEGIHLCSYAAVLPLMLLGERRRAQEILSLSLPLGEPKPDVTTTYQAELFLATRMAIQSGEFQRAAAFGSQLRSMNLGDGPMIGMTDLISHLPVSAPIGDPPEAGISEQDWGRVERLWQRRMRLAAVGTGLILTETSPDLERARIVAGWIAEVGEPSLVASAEFVVALAERNPDGLVACAPGLERSWRISRAGVAWAFAEDWFRHAGRFAEADSAGENAALLNSRHPDSELDLSLQRLPSLLLSDREREVVSLVRRGLSNRQIAEELVLSVRTVENHLYRVFRKTKLSSRNQLGELSG